ncbi:MAG: hypothetical protein DRQ89_12600 [Epsilonproteobacteria bacterium]|nr:MAG: hypothetical protein DRQ89_12600 [Campylobacterota bacterium]
MNVMTPRWAILIISLLPMHFASAQSIGDMTLSEVLGVAMERAVTDLPGNGAQAYQSSSWLAALPSVSISYLDSDERYGNDETELSLNLPIKSGGQRRADNKLQQLGSEFDAASQQHKALYLSGLIREAVWSYKISAVKQASAERKNLLLKRLEQRYQQLLAANAASEYSLLLIQKELVRAQIEQLDLEQEVRRWLQQYKVVTGLGSMPTDISEPEFGSTGFILATHPQLRLLELGWLQRQLVLLAASNQSTPWNVTLTAKNIDSEVFEEDQYGIGIEIPLSFINIATQSHNSEWLLASRTYDIARDELRLGLQRRWDLLEGESMLLHKKSTLLDRSGALSEGIKRQSNELKAFNELGEEIILRQMIEAIDSQAAISINKALIHQNNAMLRQAAGIPL